MTQETWYSVPCPSLDQSTLKQAQEHQAKLTKPLGSLGQLEKIATQFAAYQGQLKPSCEKILVRVFAADHGVCQQQISAFPQAVTTQMIHNFIAGGAAISVLSRRLNADFAVVNMGTITPTDEINSPHFINHQLMPGTHDFSKQAAMSKATLQQALQAGRDALLTPLTDAQTSSDTQKQLTDSADIFIAGEMGIGNTTSASAIYSLLLSIAPEQSVGPGTGVDKEGIAMKRKVIYRAFNQHGDALDSNDPLSILQQVGGLEIAALVGAYIAAAQQGLPILVDGFITTAAALLAVKLNPSVRHWMMFSHQSAEPAHQLALQHLEAKPLLDLGMRLGEGSGAATALPLIQTALALHAQMATFDHAGVSGANPN